MIERYSRPEMRSIWTEQRKLEIWLEIETLACEGMAELGIVPKEDAKTIREKGTFRIEEVREIEKRTNHDVIAFLEEVANHVGEPARWIHRGLTSSDLLDTTLAVQMVQSADILLKDLEELRVAIAARAKELQASLEKEGLTLSEGERNKREQELARLTQQFQRLQREFREDLNIRRNEEMAGVLERVNVVIKRIAESDKLDLVFQEAVYRSPRIDITEKVLKALSASDK
jgi:Skp family chaperone for outer membrane proteins